MKSVRNKILFLTENNICYSALGEFVLYPSKFMFINGEK